MDELMYNIVPLGYRHNSAECPPLYDSQVLVRANRDDCLNAA